MAADGTPIAADEEKKTFYLFTQAFQSGHWSDNGDGTFQLVLKGGIASTIYFSDRPDRIFGASPTDAFLNGLGFIDSNPPNAAIVVDDDGTEIIEVIELYSPVFDASTDTLTYTARTLEAYEISGGEEAMSRAGNDMPLPEEFGMGALFIDDCPNGDVKVKGPDFPKSPVQYGIAACCYSYPSCVSCGVDYSWVIPQYYASGCGPNNERGCFTIVECTL